RSATLAAATLSADLQAGSLVSRYKVVRLIGEGGMGSVYEAHDPLLDRKLAIKVLRGPIATEDMHMRLLLEAQALARLKDPHVVSVYDVGRSDGRIFIA